MKEHAPAIVIAWSALLAGSMLSRTVAENHGFTWGVLSGAALVLVAYAELVHATDTKNKVIRTSVELAVLIGAWAWMTFYFDEPLNELYTTSLGLVPLSAFMLGRVVVKRLAPGHRKQESR